MRTTLGLVLASLLAAACGGSDNPKADAAPSGGPDAAIVDAAPGTPDAPPSGPDAEPAPFELSSPAIPNSTDLLDPKYTCDGDNVSPPLNWGPGPAGTKSYAIVFRDKTSNNFLHSVIWDIPVDVHALPEHVENVAMPSVPAGAKQVHGYDGHTYGYLGPCPQGSVHEYEFVLIAVDVDTLPVVTTSSTRADVVNALGQHTVESTTLATRSNAGG